MLITGLLAYLEQQTALTSTVGNRVQPVPAPEDLSQYPVVTYQLVSYTTDYANDGPDGVSQMRLVFDCHAQRYLDAITLAQTLASILNGYTGTLPDGTRVYQIEIANILDGFNDGSRIYKTSVHALVQFAE